jgi:hypothetical protein
VSQGFHLQFVRNDFFPVDADIHEGIRLVVVVPIITRKEERVGTYQSGVLKDRDAGQTRARGVEEAHRVDIVARLSIQGECEPLVGVLVER